MGETVSAQRSDSDVRDDVLEELDWDSRVRPSKIGVSVEGGIVTLTGTVESFPKRWAAQEAVWRVLGVTAVANDIEVRLPSSAERTDGELAKAAITALTWDAEIPTADLKVTVTQGWVTLQGTVDTAFQRQQAVRAVHRLAGVKGVTDVLMVRAPRAVPNDVKDRIGRALLRNAQTDAQRIQVDVEGQKVILRGTVRSYAERAAAERLALSAPSIDTVENELIISPLS